jgi:hypothetical protein
LGFDRTSAMNARSLPNVTKTSVQMRSRLCPQERQANPSTPDLSLADDPWLPQKDLGAFELALSSALPGRSLFDPPLSPFVDYQDSAISPRRDKDVRLNNIAALPSGETSHSCSSFSVKVNRRRDRLGHRRTSDRAAAARRGHRRRARRHRQKLKRQFTPNFRSQIPDQLAE